MDKNPRITVEEYIIWLFVIAIVFTIYWLTRKHETNDYPENPSRIGIFSTDGKSEFILVFLLFLFVARGIADLYMAIAYDSAMNFLIAATMIGSAATVIWEKTKPFSLFLIGGVSLARAAANILIVAPYISLSVISDLPLSALPSMILSYFLPIGIGAYFIVVAVSRRRAPGRSSPE